MKKSWRPFLPLNESDGWTLVEVIVVVLIMAVLSVSFYTGGMTALKAVERITERAKENSEIQLFSKQINLLARRIDYPYWGSSNLYGAERLEIPYVDGQFDKAAVISNSNDVVTIMDGRGVTFTYERIAIDSMGIKKGENTSLVYLVIAFHTDSFSGEISRLLGGSL